MRPPPLRLLDRQTARFHLPLLLLGTLIHGCAALFQDLPLRFPLFLGSSLAGLVAAAQEPSDDPPLREFRRRAYAAWLFALLITPAQIWAYGLEPALWTALSQLAAGGLAAVWSAALRRAPWAAALGVAVGISLAIRLLG